MWVVHNIIYKILPIEKAKLVEDVIFWGKIVQFCTRITGNWKIFVVSIFFDAYKIYTVVFHSLFQDKSCDTKLNRSKMCYM